MAAISNHNANCMDPKWPQCKVTLPIEQNHLTIHTLKRLTSVLQVVVVLLVLDGGQVGLAAQGSQRQQTGARHTRDGGYAGGLQARGVRGHLDGWPTVGSVGQVLSLELLLLLGKKDIRQVGRLGRDRGTGYTTHGGGLVQVGTTLQKLSDRNMYCQELMSMPHFYLQRSKCGTPLDNKPWYCGSQISSPGTPRHFTIVF